MTEETEMKHRLASCDKCDRVRRMWKFWKTVTYSSFNYREVSENGVCNCHRQVKMLKTDQRKVDV